MRIIPRLLLFVASALLILFSRAGYLSLPAANAANGTLPPPDDAHLTLNVRLQEAPTRIDPAYLRDTTEAQVIEQLFSGLVDRNDRSGAIEPDLAQSWTISADGLRYIFTLHPNLRWSDGTGLTAEDVRYSLLRLLDPAIGSTAAESLFMIKGAADFHAGNGPASAVGIQVLSPTEVRIDLNAPSRLLLTALASGSAGIVPRSAIEAYGEAWTLPGNLLASGSYRLAATNDEQLVYEKNPRYVHAEDVQIVRINQFIVADSDEAWAMYQRGELDTVDVAANIALDPQSAQETGTVNTLCTYLYGFNQSVPPFDDVRVRQAFTAAIERRVLVIFGTPALTFAPTGATGHVNGFARGIGIDRNADQAQRWLAEAGYPNGEGLPKVELWYNEDPGHEFIADTIAGQWRDVLNAQVDVRALSWSELNDRIGAGELMVWRGGWCADYADGVNFLYDAVNRYRSGLGGWRNAEYDRIVGNILTAADPAAAAELYAQAEEILVESSAVLAPLYYYRARIATKPYLERTFASSGAYDFAEWRLLRTVSRVAPTGGTATSGDGAVTLTAPAGAFSQAVDLRMEPISIQPPEMERGLVGTAHEIEAIDPASGDPVKVEDGASITLAVGYGEQLSVEEETLALYFWTGSAWEQEPTSSVNMADNVVTATPDHLSVWALFGDTQRVFVPTAAK